MASILSLPLYYLNLHQTMFTLFKSSPRFPKINPINLKFVRMYMVKFEESLKNFEEVQKDCINS